MVDKKTESEGDIKYPTMTLVTRLFGLAWKFRTQFLLSLTLNILVLVLSLSGLQLMGVVIDVIRHGLEPQQTAPSFPLGWTPPSNWTALNTVTLLAVVIMLIAIIRAVTTYLYNMATARLTQGQIVPELRNELYAKLQRLSFAFFERNGSSSIFNRLTGDVQNTRLFVDGVLLQGVNMLITLAAYFFYMWHIHPTLTLACLSVVIPLAYVTHYYSGKLRPGYHKNRELSDDLVQKFSESVLGIQTVKAFGAESERISGFESGNDKVTLQQQRIFWDLSIFTPLTQILSQCSLVILFAYGGWLHLNGKIALGGGLVVFAGLLQQFTSQVVNLSTIANSVQQSLTAARRVFEVLDTPIEVDSAPNAMTPPPLRGGIEFKNVTFAYHSETPVLREISFEAKPGQVIGIFGMTGSGKTTLLSLIPRFYDCQVGEILADGLPIHKLDLDAYRRQVGIVYQESFLFSNTVIANISFGSPHATQEQVETAAKAASAHEFIISLPKGYDTVLGESGIDLSGGQRQRLALARALLLQPPILILDDPTASVDSKTEHEIVSALRKAMIGRTTFIASNRLSLLRRADTLLIMENGRLIKSGHHDQLIHQEGPYRDAALLQLVDMTLDEGREN
jgi:ATP-binding cassette subfamily B protein